MVPVLTNNLMFDPPEKTEWLLQESKSNSGETEKYGEHSEESTNHGRQGCFFATTHGGRTGTYVASAGEFEDTPHGTTPVAHPQPLPSSLVSRHHDTHPQPKALSLLNLETSPRSG